jgi:hypothetical protein
MRPLIIRPLTKASQATALALSAIATRAYKAATCVDPRLTSDAIHEIAYKAFGGSMKPDQFLQRVPATHIPASDTSTQNFVKIIKIKAHESDELEKFLLMVHDDCAAVKTGVVKISTEENDYIYALQADVDERATQIGFARKVAASGKPDFNYLQHLQAQVEEFMQNPTFFDLIKSGKLELVPALYLHGESKDLVQTFAVENKDGKAVLTPAKTFFQNPSALYEKESAIAASRLR